MTITYRVGAGLYVNLTNRCGNRCDFCVRTFSDAVGDALTLWLPREPTRAEVWESVMSRMTTCRELVFCGYGEPTERLDDLLWVCTRMRETYPDIPTRINTNGQANLIHGADVTPRLCGLVDTVSVSLNYPDAARYEAHCHPVYGGAFEALLTFTRLAAAQVPTVVMTVVDLLSASDIERCRTLAASCGAGFRVRSAMLPEGGGAAG